ncbi:VOC family protein [Microbacterium phyllosphaerae]|uniref:VOC family protein n=1 Tax=Microbacterium phyllosphaerae TaxID=124798 RepID=UPI003D64F669
MNNPVLSLSSITIDAADPRSLAKFWASAAGGEPIGTDDDVFLLTDAVHLRFHFQRASTPGPSSQKLHLDFRVPWGAREAEADRLLELGATLRRHALNENPGMRLTSLADPEGNRFCVVEVEPQEGPQRQASPFALDGDRSYLLP